MSSIIKRLEPGSLVLNKHQQNSCDFPVLFLNLKNKRVIFLRALGVEEDFTRRRITAEKQTSKRRQICFLFSSFSWSSDSTKWMDHTGAATLPINTWMLFRTALKWTVCLIEEHTWTKSGMCMSPSPSHGTLYPEQEAGSSHLARTQIS